MPAGQEGDRKWVLVVGSVGSADPHEFESACKALGEALARAGLGVVVGSFQSNTADVWVLRGVLTVDQRLIQMARPFEVGRVPPEFENVPFNVIGKSWAEARSKQLGLADAMLVIGGGAGTRNAFEKASIPVLSIPAFGGTAKSLWKGIRHKLHAEGIAEGLLEPLQSWRSEAPDATVRILQQLLKVEITPLSFLLTWDPERTPYDGTMAGASAELASGRLVGMRWTASEPVAVGDWAFLMRHGDPAGLVGHGTIMSAPKEDAHWDPKRASKGDRVWYAEVKWRELTEYPLVPVDDLIQATGDSELWMRPGNGHLIPTRYAERIELQILKPTQSAREAAAEGDPKEGLVSIERLYELEASLTVDRILSKAIEMAAEPLGADAAVTATLLALALLFEEEEEEEEEEESAAHFLQDQLIGGDRTRAEEALSTYLPFYGIQVGPSLAERRKGAYPIGWISRPVDDFLQYASRYARQVSGSELIHTRHLVAAIIRRTYDARPEPGTRRLFDSFDASEEELVEGFLTWLAASGAASEEDLALWKIVLKRDDGGTARSASLATMPLIAPESPHGEDLLGIDRDVNPLAAVMSSVVLEPPLAVGLFGDWGSGKSFFMEKLRDRVDFLADASRARARKGKPHSFHTELPQIWFNAWNYVETNLWASLVTHVFESLHQHFVPRGEKEEKQWERLLQRLDKESTRGDEARQELEAAEQGLAEAKQAQRTNWNAVAGAAKALWTQLEKSAPDLNELSKTLNVEDLRDVQESLLLRREEASALLERLPLFRRNLLRGLGSLRSLGFFAAVLVLAPALVLLVVHFLGLVAFKELGQQIGVVTGLVGSVAAWLGSAFQKASKIVDSVQAAELALQAGLRSGTLDDGALRKAERAMASAAQKVQEREQRIESLQSELGELQPSRLLTSFLANRAESQDYRKHLGLPAMIRRDFEHLQALMDQMKTEPFPLSEEAADILRTESRVPEELLLALRDRRIYLPNDARVELKPDQPMAVKHDDVDFVLRIGSDRRCTIEWERLKIDRIVLYIDDLDRCPSKRVVEVLQAVRLLLDFKLFVVVVGVDARWVTQALRTHHESQWRSPSNQRDAPEPQDFLEKIFQIPLWLEPLEDAATKRYLKGLTEGTVRTPPSKGDTHGDGSRPKETTPPTGDDAVVGEAHTAAIDTTPADKADEPHAGETAQHPAPQPERPEEAPKPEHPGLEALADPRIGSRVESNVDAAEPPSDDVAADDQESQSDGPVDPGDEVMNPPGLEMETWERDFMLELSGLLGRSPRAVKRFVNVYRLIRSSVLTQSLQQFTGTREVPGSYQAVQFLLAVIVGKPRISEVLFAHLRAAHSKGLAELVRELAEDTKLPDDKRQDLRDLLEFLEPEGRESAFRAVHYIVPDWFERVSRYSFRVGRR